MCFIPTIAGISLVLAIIAICELIPPISVIIPDIFFKFILAVSDVDNSFATNMVFWGKFDKLISLISSICFATVLTLFSLSSTVTKIEFELDKLVRTLEEN